MMVVEVKLKCRVLRWQIIPKTSCSGGYGLVGEHEMRSDRGSSRKRERGEGSGKASCLDDERFAKVIVLGVLTYTAGSCRLMIGLWGGCALGFLASKVI